MKVDKLEDVKFQWEFENEEYFVTLDEDNWNLWLKSCGVSKFDLMTEVPPDELDGKSVKEYFMDWLY